MGSMWSVGMSVQNIFSPKATRITRILLVHPKEERSILNLSEEAAVAYPQRGWLLAY